MILICVIIFARFLICMKFQFVDKFSVCIQTIPGTFFTLAYIIFLTYPLSLYDFVLFYNP